MSTPHDFPVRPSPDRIDRRPIVAVALVSLVIGAIALVVAWGLLEHWGQEPARGAPAAAPRTIGTLEQTSILDTQRGVELRAEQHAALQRWEWADRDAGLARIPIAEAMDLLAADPPPSDRGLEPATPGHGEQESSEHDGGEP
jgi:hypothetical protein